MHGNEVVIYAASDEAKMMFIITDSLNICQEFRFCLLNDYMFSCCQRKIRTRSPYDREIHPMFAILIDVHNEDDSADREKSLEQETKHAKKKM